VIPKTAKNPLSLTAVIIGLAAVNYQIGFTAGSCEGPMQVNGAFHGIEKSRVIIYIDMKSWLWMSINTQKIEEAGRGQPVDPF
jgi:hypothetical protein